MSNLLTWSYWLANHAPKFSGGGYQLMLGLMIGLVVVGIIFKIMMVINKVGPWKKLFRRLGNLFITIGALAALNFFFTQTVTPVLGARWWFLLWGLVALIWLGYIVRYAVWQLPHLLVEGKEQQEFAKYLPRKS